MNRTEVRLGAGWSKVVRATAWALMGTLLATGCGVRSGGGGGGPDTFGKDEHGNIPLEATVIIPDGPNYEGKVNYPNDIDWFKFRGIAGIGYVLQIHGFPPDPDIRINLDLNGYGDDVLQAQIVGPDGATQLVNSSASQGGSPGDVIPVGLGEVSGNLGYVGDSRFFWICPTIGDYFINIRHRRNGIGGYRFRLATSQTTTIENDIYQTGQRFVSISNDQGPIFNGMIGGGILWPRVEFIESLGSTDITDVQVLMSRLIFPPGSDTPLAPHLHAHAGYPNVFFPEDSINFTDNGDTVHDTIFDVAIPTAGFDTNTRGPVQSESVLRFADGTQARIPTTIERSDMLGNVSDTADGYKFTLHLSDALATRGGSEFAFTPELFRNITGFPWYFDLHPQPDMELDPLPITASRPEADMYSMFETPLDASPANVIPRDGVPPPPADRGGSTFQIFYDASLKLFQVATQIYEVDGLGGYGVDQPDYSNFVGDRVKVHAGGPGVNGSTIIDLGTLPLIRPPRTASPAFSRNTVFREPEGFQQPIRQLTDKEAEKLRDAFYDEGFYVEVTDGNTGQQVARAEGFLDISTFPTLEPCSFPPCSGVEPAAKPEKGVVTFASGLPEGASIDLYSNGELLGVLNQSVTTANLPGCGLDGDARTLAAELWPGTYYWHAYGKDGKRYGGHVTVPNGGCQLVVIEPDDATD